MASIIITEEEEAAREEHCSTSNSDRVSSPQPERHRLPCVPGVGKECGTGGKERGRDGEGAQKSVERV
eukprot:615062-Rhodomonas_salina.2